MLRRVRKPSFLVLVALLGAACAPGTPGELSPTATAAQAQLVSPTIEATATAIASPSATPAATLDPETLGEWAAGFVAYLENQVDENEIPGLAYALVLPDGQILAGAFGFRDVAAETPATTETLFHIGSTQKSMTAMLVAVMVDRGLLDWDTPVVEYFPGFRLSNPEYAGQVTLRHLLSMTSGIPDYAEDSLDLETASAEHVFVVAAQTGLLAAPGQVFSYSNLSAALAGYLAGYVYTGGSMDLWDGYQAALTDLVLQPIGMAAATSSVEAAQASGNLSYSYTSRGGATRLALSEDLERDPLAPAGTLKANVLELAAYLATQLNDGVAPNGNQLLSTTALQETWQPIMEDYALGWERDRYQGHDLVWHAGAFDNFVSLLAMLPEEGIGLLILANSEDAALDLTENAPYDLIDLLP